ncbi:ABC-type Fe3+/spermidine/putrescine transport system ATPase subunit [Oceanihabitans sediminis]|uniref:ABC transporter ATP-binding protein n=1 Tax=Oceanihabitans sediminis TaxID=1812012 RepID=A0A368P7G7_9FLAO|nr:ABC transporter ATP-binding protein [Oceanihabitans sediminis]RBP34745.1 ABC-type Fe3+/spermidine/putrescine transport system ATPase subunit [Oceanihabitans sediminis]RCU58396.1 ABC transporter ATP-binding protein [Oceanihabitans sediminis]
MLQVKNLSFSYKETPVLNNISFSVKPGEHLSIIGESGSGKSTLLKVLYGKYDLNEGNIYRKETEILGPKFNLVVGYDFMKYVAQEFDLMPFTSVAENIGKHLSNFYPEEKQERTKELLEIVELTPFANTKVKLLSGGQKQRVALARALANTPEILLLDEPFSHIDNFKKQSLRRNVFRYLKEKNIACIVATHDKEDVLGFADSMIVLNNKKLLAHDKPESLYRNPKTPLIAAFFEEFSIISNEIVYASRLQVVENSDLEVTVKNSYFKGSYYLIEAVWNNENVYFEHREAINRNTKTCLSVVDKK